ncbi:endonuclease VIII [Sinanaerobacter chloroacetimidivorans]|jgi:formamidopyrimidine-DNA glycosylase|uniref:Endonuclease VIII n=1 Tax=Sinanaerobacter chloroacetimidivorans TaxID=2818044 RepID=A0A8J7W4G3_9FIRM|nr:endonuclease VIII [Sinanaerobacter chloroacetimidivorans]MBR0599010.1 endonuclease VIII [Sinanaerobacter chloroacetimidivorans]
MLEIPESHTIARQMNETITGKVIKTVQANSSPHGFAFYFGDPKDYHDLLKGKKLEKVQALSGQVEIIAEDARILFNDGINIRYYADGDKIPEKHQLLIQFEDHSRLVCTVQMYGGLWAYPEGANDNPYYLAARDKISPLADHFDRSYFHQLFNQTKKNLSTKAFLATEQRIPGLGNGVLQDILFNAGIHPRRKLETFSAREVEGLYQSLKETLAAMTARGGRNTEKDLFGNPGGYPTALSAKTWKDPCPQCGSAIIRQAFLGGNVYFCPYCQPLEASIDI